MPSGPTRIIYNTRERLISTDPNRAQSFAAMAMQEAWRSQYNDVRSNWRLYPGLSSKVQIIGAPLYGEVYAGLFVRPDVASYLTIDAGLAMMVSTNTPGVDDSPYLYVNDPGVSTPGVLAFTSNPTPSTVRWDVIECQPVDTLLESSSRDIYNPATGLFAPVVVDKVRSARLTYRIRLGGAGTGFPGAAAGWLPLAVCAVRDGATGFNQCDFYDVRPLVTERVLPQPVGTAGNEGLAIPGTAHYQSFTGKFFGYAEGEFAGYLAGGVLRTSVPAAALADFGVSNTTTGGDNLSIDAANTANLGAYTLGSVDMAYVAALFPVPPLGQGFIPRWARYCEAVDGSLGRRVPKGPRGILTITTTQPGPNGLFAPMAFPTNSQLGVSGIGPAVALATTHSGAAYGYSVQKDRLLEHSKVDGDVWGFAATSIAADLAVWNMVAGTHFPPNARAVRVSFTLVVTAAAGFSSLQVRSTSNGFPFTTIYIPTGFGTGALVGSSAARSVITLVRPPLGTDPYPVANSVDWSIRVVPPIGTTGITFDSANIQIHGWEF